VLDWLAFAAYVAATLAARALGAETSWNRLSGAYTAVFMTTVIAALPLTALVVLGAVVDAWHRRLPWRGALARALGVVAVTSVLFGLLRRCGSPFVPIGFPG
jgi:hypothetical protein